MPTELSPHRNPRPGNVIHVNVPEWITARRDIYVISRVAAFHLGNVAVGPYQPIRLYRSKG